MKQHPIIFRLLCTVILLMIVAPVVPHHHHANGVICMKADIPAEGGCSNYSCHDTCHHCCSDTCCPSTHNYQQASIRTMPAPAPLPTDLLPAFINITGLFQLLTKGNAQHTFPPYIEHLHALLPLQGWSLRAPPILA